MNHFYRTIWNKASNSFVAVPENTASCGKASSSKKSVGKASSAHKAVSCAIAAALLAIYSNAACADASSGTVLTGTNAVNATAASGANTIIDGASGTGYFVQSGSLAISNATLQNFATTGGAGSGGGAGLGGAVFVNNGASVVLNNVNLYHNIVVGGAGGSGSTGGTLNNMPLTNIAGSNGSSGSDAPSGAAYVNGGNGGNGYNGAAGNNASHGIGGTGGNGGAGSAGSAVTADTIKAAGDAIWDAVKTATDTTNVGIYNDIGAAFAEAAIEASAQVAGPLPVVSTLGTALGQLSVTYFGIADGEQPTLVSADGAKILIDAAYTTALTVTGLVDGVAGNGGSGGNGGNGAKGSAFFGGGAGGNGGNGGAAESTSAAIGGGGGNGANGGNGGFGGGGGAGGNGGTGGTSASSVAGIDGGGGSGGTAGFGAGAGASGSGYDSVGGGGSGGNGDGGAIFVAATGSLLITGNATFFQNAALGGDGQVATDSLAGGSAGSGAGSDLFMMKGSTVVLAPGVGNVITFNGTIADNSGSTGVADGHGASLTVQGGGLVVFNGANTYSGQTIISNDGVLQAQDGTGISANSNINLASSNMAGGVLQSNGTFSRFTGTASPDIQWTGSGGFAAAGGALTVTLNNDDQLTWGHSGFVSNANALIFGSDTATDAVTFTNAMDLNGGNGTILVASNADNVATNEVNKDTATLTGVISDGSLTVGDAGHTGLLYLTAANTYTGGTTINDGTLALLGAQALIGSGTLAVNNNGVLDISGAGSQSVGSLSGTGAGVVSLGANTLTVTQTGSSTFSGVLQDGGMSGGTGAGVILQGGGTLTLSGANTYTGTTNVIASTTLNLTGSLMSGSVNIGSGSTLNDTNSGLAANAALSNDGTVNLGADDTVASLTNTGTINGTNTLTAATYALNNGSVINANLGAGVMTDNGAVQINGTSSAATVNIASGTTTLGSAERLLDTVAVTVSSTSNLLLGGAEKIGSLFGAGNVDLTAGILTVDSGNFSGVLQSSNSTYGLTKVSSGTLTLSGANTYTGTTNVNAGTLTLNGSLASTTTNVNAGTLTLNGTLASGTVNVVSGATLNDNNSNGLAATAILTNAGTVNLAVNNTITTLNNTGTLNGTGTLTAANYNLNNGSVINANLGTGTLTTHGTVTLAGTSAANVVNVNTGSTLNLGNSPAVVGGTLATLTNSPIVTVNGQLNLNNGSETINTLSGSGTINENTYQLNVAQGGTFTGNILTTNSQLNTTGGTLTLTGATVTQNTTVTNGSTLSITTAGGSVSTQSTSITGNSTLKVGSGSTFSATATGGTGIINVAGGSGITLESGAVLNYVMLNGGSAATPGGTITAANFTNATGSSVEGFLTFTGNFVNNGILAPGNSPGTTTIGGNYTENATLQAQIQTTAAGGYDQVRVAGTVTLNPNSTLVVQPYGGIVPVSGNVYQTIANSTGGAIAINGAFGNVLFGTNTSPNAAAVFDLDTGRLLTTGLNASNSVFADLGTTPSQRAAANALMAVATSGHVDQIHSTTAAGNSAYALLSANGATASANAARLVPEQYAGLANFGLLSSQAVSDFLFVRSENAGKASGMSSGDTVDDKSVFVGYMNNKDNVTSNNVNRNDAYIGAEGGSGRLIVGALAMSSTGSISSTYGSGDVKGQGATLYARSAVSPVLSILASIGYSGQDFRLNRASVTGAAQGTTSAHGMNASVGATYLAYDKDELSILPRISLNYADMSVNGFTETGSAQALNLAGYKATRTDLQAGVLFSRNTNLNGHAVKLALNAGVDSAINDNKGNMNAIMVTSPQVQFPISFASDRNTSGMLGLSVNYEFTQATSMYMKYDYHRYGNSGRVELNIAF